MLKPAWWSVTVPRHVVGALLMLRACFSGNGGCVIIALACPVVLKFVDWLVAEQRDVPWGIELSSCQMKVMLAFVVSSLTGPYCHLSRWSTERPSYLRIFSK